MTIATDGGMDRLMLCMISIYDWHENMRPRNADPIQNRGIVTNSPWISLPWAGLVDFCRPDGENAGCCFHR